MVLATAVWAADAPDFTKDPAIGVKRVMTKVSKTTDSQCVGDPKTPVCALETMLACLVRQEPELCRKIGIRSGCFDKVIYSGKYMIDRVGGIKHDDLLTYMQKKEWLLPEYADVSYNIAYCNRHYSLEECDESFRDMPTITLYRYSNHRNGDWIIAGHTWIDDLCDGLDTDD
jgi:hypothetical protein